MMQQLLYAGIVFLSISTFRSFWVAKKIEEYQFKCLHYLTMNPKIDTLVGVEMAQLWPKFFVHWEWWNWDFSRYIIHHDHYEKMNAWFDVQLERDDLDEGVFHRELREIEKEAYKKLLEEENPKT